MGCINIRGSKLACLVYLAVRARACAWGANNPRPLGGVCVGWVGVCVRQWVGGKGGGSLSGPEVLREVQVAAGGAVLGSEPVCATTTPPA